MATPMTLVDANGIPVGTSSSPFATAGAAYSFDRATGDKQIKASAGTLHAVTISPTGAVTAGVITLYNSLTETGTVLFSVALPVTTFTPFTVTLDVPFSTGLYCGFDGTLANVQATFTYL